jgi:acetyl esterase/lipase
MSSIKRISYGDDAQQFADLYLPGGAGPHPVGLLIHGGFWRAPYTLRLMTGLAEDLAQRGIAAWNIEYRRVGNAGGGWPGTLQDAAAATDYLATLGEEYPLDLQRVVTIGHSAGGHLALWLAARSRLPQNSPFASSHAPLTLKGAISLAGAIDLEEVWKLHLGQDAALALLGGSPHDFPERYTTASPAALLPLGIPQVLVHGTNDDRVPLQVSQNYAHKATEAGDTVTLIELPAVDHFEVIDPHSAAWSRTRDELQKLLQ